MYKLEQKDTVATLEVGIDSRTHKQILQLMFNRKVVAVFDSGEQLRWLDPAHMGEWRESK